MGWTALAVLALSGSALAGCGGDDDDNGNVDDVRGATGTAGGSPQASPSRTEAASSATRGTSTAGTTIVQQDLQFKPTELQVKSGDTVTFTNEDQVPHTVTVNGKNESGIMRKGDTFEWKAPAAGTYQITCDFHPDMHATITVT